MLQSGPTFFLRDFAAAAGSRGRTWLLPATGTVTGSESGTAAAGVSAGLG